MTTLSTSNIDYSSQISFWVDYGVYGRFIKGPFKDMENKYQEVSQIINPDELA